MTLSSMTGFAREAGAWNDYHWTWEIKSVNGRNLDVRFRMPIGLDAVEQAARKIIKDHIARGSINVNLQLSRDAASTAFKVNQEMLDILVEVAIDTSMRNHLPQPSLDALMGIRDVIQYIDKEEDEETILSRDKILLKSFDSSLKSFMNVRDTEGSALQIILNDILNDIEIFVKQAGELAKEMPEIIKKRYMDKVNALLDDKAGFDPDRIAQEVVLLATKADIKEEIDRLYAHIEAGRRYLKSDGQIGRKLDFLTQEFNREANTLCSKASDIRLTEIGLSLKTLIDQFREQVQNIE
ncbi:MAG: YicC family protein [Emcibacter sp.]|nr:YicC family protein [Emcibacter sp.]